MFKIILGFLPWILYFVIAGKTRDENQAAIVVALLTTVLFDFKALKKGFVLTVGTMIFFLGLFLASFFVSSTWIEDYANIISNSALTLIAWISLFINKPFTLQYAREEVDSQYCEVPGFLFVNQVITIVWAVSFLIMTVMNFYESSFNQVLYQIISYGPSIFSIWFTRAFPDWYKGYQFEKLSRQKEDLSKNPFLQGNFAPIRTEIDVPQLLIEGVLPKTLNGIYMRNGANPFFDPISYTYPVDGDGMLHAIYIRNGKASYRNRFIETKALVAEKKAGKALYGGVRRPIPTDPKMVGKKGDEGPIKNGVFVHIIKHLKKYIALGEAGEAYEVTENLKTIGTWCPDNIKSPFHVNAHTRLDPKTKELFTFNYDEKPRSIQCHVLNDKGEISKNFSIQKTHSSMMHDFVLTENHLVFFDCPAIFDFEQIKKGGCVLQWNENLPVKIIVANRHDSTFFTIETDSFLVYHFVNGYEKNNQIVIDYVRHEKLSLDPNNLIKEKPTWYRAVIDLKMKTIKHVQCDDRIVEFPRMNDMYQTKHQQFSYMSFRSNSTDSYSYNAIVKYDCDTQKAVTHDFGKSMEIGEPIFIPKNNSQSEDDGYIGFFGYDNGTQKSEFILLSAQAIEDKPIARIHIPQRVPHGLHGNWFSENSI